MSAAVTSGVRLAPVSDSEVSMSFHTPSCSTRTGPANASVCNSPEGSAYVVESAVRSDRASILRPCSRAISNADAPSAASAGPDTFADIDVVVVVEDSTVTAVACPASSTTMPVSTASSSDSAPAIWRNRLPARSSADALNGPGGPLANQEPITTPSRDLHIRDR